MTTKRIRDLEKRDRLKDYPWTTVRRVYEYGDLFGKKKPVIEFESGLKVFPNSMDDTVEVEKGGEG